MVLNLVGVQVRLIVRFVRPACMHNYHYVWILQGISLRKIFQAATKCIIRTWTRRRTGGQAYTLITLGAPYDHARCWSVDKRGALNTSLPLLSVCHYVVEDFVLILLHVLSLHVFCSNVRIQKLLRHPQLSVDLLALHATLCAQPPGLATIICY